MHGAPCKVGIGTPGAISQVTGLMKNSNSVALNGKPLKEDLERVLERPIRMAQRRELFRLIRSSRWCRQRTRCCLWNHSWYRCWRRIGYQSKVRTGLHAIAGEWGHNVLRDSRRVVLRDL